MGKYELVTESVFDGIDLGMYYENMVGLISNLFTYYGGRYFENRCVELHVLSDPVIVDCYKLTGEYGRRHKIPDKDNSYIKAAEQEVHGQLNFCYGIGWKVLGYTRTRKTARQSRLIVYSCSCDCGCHDHLAYGLIQLYKWFSDKVIESKEQTEVIAA